MTVYVAPNQPGSKVSFKARYENFIGGEWRKPQKEKYFENVTPVTGKVFTEVARSTAEDIDAALDAAHKAKHAWGKTSAAQRALVLNKIADRMEQNLELLAVAETWDNGKPIRETLAADIPLAIDHFRYFAGVIRALGAGVWTRDQNTAFRAGRAIQAGRVWTNCYHLYPAHAAFGGYKQSGIGRENHAQMLGHYQQTKNLLVSYSEKAMGFF